MKIQDKILTFIPHIAPVSLAEKVRSGIAGGVAILLLALAVKYFPQNLYSLTMFASMAASALLLFAVPHSPLAQPWNLVGGHIVSALAGWACILFINDPLLSAGISVGAAIFLMHYLHCLHPPGAATALTLVVNSAQFQNVGFKGVMVIVIINTVFSLLLALIINNVIPGRQYPIRNIPQVPSTPDPFISLEQQDLELALIQMESVIDVSEEDLAQIYKFAVLNAQKRRQRSN